MEEKIHAPEQKPETNVDEKACGTTNQSPEPKPEPEPTPEPKPTPKPKPEKKKRFKEGRRIKTLPPMSVFMPYVMKDRNDACNYISDSIDISAIEDYVFKKRAEGCKNFGIMHVIIAAYVRTIAEKPGVNRFIRGQRVWSRNNIEVMLTIKKEMKLNSPDTVIKIFPEATDTATDVYNRINELVLENKQEGESDFDKTAKALTSIPGLVIRGLVGLLYFFDYFGLLPRFLTKVSPFHGSMFITSMGSLGIPPIYHHIYNFGNVPIFISFGAKRTEYYIDKDGSTKERKMVDLKIVTDERICDGYYYATFLKAMRFYLKNPDKLDNPPKEVIPDID